MGQPALKNLLLDFDRVIDPKKSKSQLGPGRFDSYMPDIEEFRQQIWGDISDILNDIKCSDPPLLSPQIKGAAFVVNDRSFGHLVFILPPGIKLIDIPDEINQPPEQKKPDP